MSTLQLQEISELAFNWLLKRVDQLKLSTMLLQHHLANTMTSQFSASLGITAMYIVLYVLCCTWKDSPQTCKYTDNAEQFVKISYLERTGANTTK